MKNTAKTESAEITVPALDYYSKPVAFSAKQVTASQAEYNIMRSLNRACWVYRNRREEVLTFMDNLQVNISFEGLATSEGQIELSKFIFENAFNREFLKTITVGFTALHAEWHGSWDNLLHDIAYGIGYTPISGSGSSNDIVVPVEITDRANTTSEIALWIQSNNWIAVLLMVKLWGVVPDDYAK